MFKYPIYRFDRIIKNKIGIPAMLHQVANTFSPITGTVSGPTVTDTPVLAAVSLSEDTFEGKDDTEDTLYEILISNVALGVTPVIGDQVIIGPTTYRIVKRVPGYIGPTVASWELQALG